MGTHKIEIGQAGRNVARAVRERRRALGYTLTQLSAILRGLGRPIIVSGLAKIEAGDRKVNVDDLVALADALQTTTDQLLRGDPPEEGRFDHIQLHHFQALVDAVDEAEGSPNWTRSDTIHFLARVDAHRRFMAREEEIGPEFGRATGSSAIVFGGKKFKSKGQRG